MSPPLVQLDDILAARERLRPVLRPTPVDRSDALSRLAGRPVLLKPEYRQRTGSFKIRGAYNRISRLPPGQEVVAASAGNHAQGVALAAALTDRPSTIYMPKGASLPKIEATRTYGAQVILEGEVIDDCIALAERYAEDTGAVFVSPFDDPDVIAGQGTIGLELLDEAAEAGTVVVPVGGGGLIAGIAAAMAYAGSAPKRIVGVEAAGAPTMTEAIRAGQPVALDRMSTMADGIAVGRCSALTLAHALAHVDEMVTVDEEELSRALILAMERAKAVVEPAGAAGLAALLSGRVSGSDSVVVVLSGGNIDPLLLTKLIEHGLAAAGRFLTLRVVAPDRAGALAGLTAELARLRLNVLSVEHHRHTAALDVEEVEIMVTVETRDRAHHTEVLEALAAAGYRAAPIY